ncbi:hypothetical protein [Cellulomonas sp. URHB0016]
MNRSAGALFVAMAVLATSACDPSPPDTDVVLSRTLQGQLQLVVNLCEYTLDYVEIGTGTDWGRRGEIRITPTADMQGRLVIDLPDPGDAFDVKDADDLEAMTAPFFTTVWVDDGELASQAFDVLPEPGEMTYISPVSGDSVVAPASELDRLQTCSEPNGGADS